MDNSNILALKYRPTKLADLIGQDAAVQALTNAFNDNNLYQCFVFAGSFGCGKTSAARILAAMENCEKGRTLEPCGQCRMCREIFSGESNDIREVNAASANGIDDIRNVADFVSIRPLLARVKYVIFDECHAWSRQAVESALKMLEEPPDRVRFVLCTTDLHKLKGTIQTRCMPFRFVKVAWPVIAQHLASVAAKEGIEADEGALKLAAKLSDGSVRNSLRNLQLMATQGGKKVTIEAAQQSLGAIDDDKWFNLIDAMMERDATNGMRVIQELFSRGMDVGQILNGLVEHLHTLLVLCSCSNTAGLLFLSEEEKKRYVHQIGKLSIEVIVEMISLLHEITRGLQTNMNAQLLFDQYLVKCMVARSRIEKAKSG